MLHGAIIVEILWKTHYTCQKSHAKRINKY